MRFVLLVLIGKLEKIKIMVVCFKNEDMNVIVSRDVMVF